jgi:hypothetical protein
VQEAPQGLEFLFRFFLGSWEPNGLSSIILEDWPCCWVPTAGPHVAKGSCEVEGGRWS